MNLSKDKILVSLDQTYVFNLDLQLLYSLDQGEYYFYKDGLLLLENSRLSFYSIQDSVKIQNTDKSLHKEIELKDLKAKKAELKKIDEKRVSGEIRVEDDFIYTKDKVLFETDTRELIYYLKDNDLGKYLDYSFEPDNEAATKLFQYQYLVKKDKDLIDFELLEKCGSEFIKCETKSSAKSISSIKKLLNYGLKQLSLDDTIDQILNENYDELYNEMNDQLELQILLDRLSVFEEIYIKSFIDVETEYQKYLDFESYTQNLASSCNDNIFKLLPFCDYSILEYFPLHINVLFTPKSKKEYYFKIFQQESDFVEETVDTTPILSRIQELRNAGLFMNAANMIDYYLQDTRLSSMVQSSFTIEQIQQMPNQELIENCENVQLLKILDSNEKIEFVKINIEKGNLQLFVGTEMFDYVIDYFSSNDLDVDFNEWYDILNQDPKSTNNDDWEGDGWDIDDDLQDIQYPKVQEMRKKLEILELFHSFGLNLNFYRLQPQYVLPALRNVPLDRQVISDLLKANEIIKIDTTDLNTVLFERALLEKKFNLLETIPLSPAVKTEIKRQITGEWLNLDTLGNRYQGYFKDILNCNPPRDVVELIEICHEFIHTYHLKVKPKDLCLNKKHYLEILIAENELYNETGHVSEMARKLGLDINIVELCAKVSIEKKDFVTAYQLLRNTQSDLVSELVLNDEFQDSQAKLLLACNQEDMQLFNLVEQSVFAVETNQMHDFYCSVGSPIHDDYIEPHINLDLKIAQLLESNEFEYQVEFFEQLPKTPENINLASYFFNLKAYIASSTPFTLNPEPFQGENKYKQQSLLYQSKIKSVESKQLLQSLGLTEDNLDKQLVQASKTTNEKVFAQVLRIANEYQIEIEEIVKARVLYLISISDLQPLSRMMDLVEYFPEIDIHEPNNVLLAYYKLTNKHPDRMYILENLKEKDLEAPLNEVLKAQKQPELFIDIFNDYCRFLSIKDFIWLFNEWIDEDSLLECVKLYIDNIPWITLDKDTALYLVQDLVGINDLEISDYLFFKTFPDVVVNSFAVKPELDEHYNLLIESNEKYHQELNDLYKLDKSSVFIKMIQDDDIPNVDIDSRLYQQAIEMLIGTRQFEKLKNIQSKYSDLIKEIMKTQPSDVKLILMDLLNINDENERLVSLAQAVWKLDLYGESKEYIINSMIENTMSVSQAIQLIKLTDSPALVDKLTELEFDILLLYISIKNQRDYTINGFHRYFYGILTNDKQVIKEFVQLPLHKEHKLLYQLLVIQGYFGFEKEILDMIDGPFEYVLGCILLTRCDYKIKIIKKLRNIPDGMFNGCDWQRILKIVMQSCIEGWNIVEVDELLYVEADFYGAVLNNCLARSKWLQEFQKMI
ncbi:hypothetical protein HDV04_000331 [Boothiomyces sp. JEL0838]|nr:hypothetical protein HDV04_000331 [Boothiomyces sp. JEL0838]